MDDWKEALPEPLRDAPFLGKAENLDDAVGKLAHAAKLVGTSIRIPGEDASDDARAEFYGKLAEVPGVAQLPVPDDTDGFRALMGKLGRPDEAKDYLAPEVEGHEWQAETLKQLQTYAHEAGMTNAQFQQLASQIASQAVTDANAAEAERKAQREQLQAEWGEALGQREQLVANWLEASGAPEAMRALLDSKQLTAESMKWLHQTAMQFQSEPNPMTEDGKGVSPEVTPEEAQAKIAEILANPAYFDQADPRQKTLMAQMLKYQALAHPPSAA